jgi:hypothetical protein
MKMRVTVRKFGMFVLALFVGLSLTVRADDDRNGRDDQRRACGDDGENHDHHLRTPLKLIGAIPVPGNPILSADIAWVDPGTEAYYLADRSNAGIDIINVETGFYLGRVTGLRGVAGAADGTAANNGSGPNGVVVTPGRRAWTGDGGDLLVVADVDPDSASYLSILKSINLSVTDPKSPSFCDNGAANGHWCGRADEIGYDPRHHVILIATPGPLSPTAICPTPTNPAAHCSVEPYANLVSADPPYAILATFSFTNAGGLEQPLWDPGLNRFWLTVPGTANSNPRIVRIDSTKHTIDKTITLDCNALGGTGTSITGIALAPFQHLLVSACGFPVDVSAISGNAKIITQKVGGGDQVWFNPGDGRFYVTGRDASNTQQLGVIDAEHDSLLQLIPVSAGPLTPTGKALTSGRNPAAFSENNRVFVDTPVTAAIAAGTAKDDSTCTQFGIIGRGCIAVYAHSGDEDDPDDRN